MCDGMNDVYVMGWCDGGMMRWRIARVGREAIHRREHELEARVPVGEREHEHDHAAQPRDVRWDVETLAEDLSG